MKIDENLYFTDHIKNSCPFDVCFKVMGDAAKLISNYCSTNEVARKRDYLRALTNEIALRLSAVPLLFASLIVTTGTLVTRFAINFTIVATNLINRPPREGSGNTSLNYRTSYVCPYNNSCDSSGNTSMHL